MTNCLFDQFVDDRIAAMVNGETHYDPFDMEIARYYDDKNGAKYKEWISSVKVTQLLLYIIYCILYTRYYYILGITIYCILYTRYYYILGITIY